MTLPVVLTLGAPSMSSRSLVSGTHHTDIPPGGLTVSSAVYYDATGEAHDLRDGHGDVVLRDRHRMQLPVPPAWASACADARGDSPCGRRPRCSA